MGHLLYTLALANRSKNRSNPAGLAVSVPGLAAHGVTELDSRLQGYFPEEAIEVVDLEVAASAAQGSAEAPGLEGEEPLPDMDEAMRLLDEADSNPASPADQQPPETSTPGAASTGEAESSLEALTAVVEELPGLLSQPPDSSPPLEAMEASEVEMKENPFTLVDRRKHSKKKPYKN